MFTQKMNKKYKRKGHLFQGRYKSMLVQKENYLMEVSRYIVLNPVRAKMVETVSEWLWSSYRATVRNTRRLDDRLARNDLLQYFNDNEKSAVRKYRAFIKDGLKMDSPFKNHKGSLYLGDEVYQQTIAKVLTKRRKLKDIPRESRYEDLGVRSLFLTFVIFGIENTKK